MHAKDGSIVEPRCANRRLAALATRQDGTAHIDCIREQLVLSLEILPVWRDLQKAGQVVRCRWDKVWNSCK